jgi:hypothetical protein
MRAKHTALSASQSWFTIAGLSDIIFQNLPLSPLQALLQMKHPIYSYNIFQVTLIRYINLVFLVGFCLLSQGCAQFVNAFSSSYSVASMKGKPATMLVAQYGLPDFKYPDGHGGEIWGYQSSATFRGAGTAYTSGNYNVNSSGTAYLNPSTVNYNGNSYGNGTSSTIYAPPSEESYSKISCFFVNKEGIIYDTSFRMALR